VHQGGTWKLPVVAMGPGGTYSPRFLVGRAEEGILDGRVEKMRIPMFLGSAALAILAGRVPADTITLVDGTVLSDVTVLSTSIQEVTFRDGRKSKSLPSWKVEEIKPSNPPRYYRLGLQALNEDDVESAVSSFRKFAERTSPKSSHAWLRPFALWKVAMLFIQEGDAKGWSDGVAEIEAMNKKFPDNFFLPRYYKLKFVHYLDQGDEGKVNLTRLIANWIKKIQANKYPDTYLYLAQLDQIMVQRDILRKLSPSQALPKIQAVLSKCGSTAPLAATRAKVELGWTLLALGRADEARKNFEEARWKPMFCDIHEARAWLGLGLSYIQKKGIDKEGYKKALLDFMRVVINFEDLGEKSFYARNLIAEALYYAEDCYKKWGGPQWQDCCRRLRARRKVRYKTTLWGRRK